MQANCEKSSVNQSNGQKNGGYRGCRKTAAAYRPLGDASSRRIQRAQREAGRLQGAQGVQSEGQSGSGQRSTSQQRVGGGHLVAAAQQRVAVSGWLPRSVVEGHADVASNGLPRLLIRLCLHHLHQRGGDSQ